MSVFKNIQIGLLCTTVVLSSCFGMEQSQKKEEGKQTQMVSIASTPAEKLYQEAVAGLHEFFNSPFNSTDTKIQLKSVLDKLKAAGVEHGHEPSFALFKIVVTAYVGPTKLSYPLEMKAAQIKLHYFMGLEHVGFSLIRSALLNNNNAINTFLNDVLYNKQIVSCFFKGFPDDEELLKLQHIILNSYYVGEFNSKKSSELDADMQAHIGGLYITAANSKDVDVMDLSQQQISKNRAYAYLGVGLKYCILAAKQDNELAYELILSTLEGNDAACELYYKYLIPFLESNDEQAQHLFNRVASENEKVFFYFDSYASSVFKKDRNSPLLQYIDRVMNGFDRYRRVKYNSQGQIGLYNLIEGTDYFAHESPIVGTFASSISDNPLSPQEQFKQAMSCWASDPGTTLSLFFDILSLENISKSLVSQVNKKIAEIKKTNGYRKHELVKEADKASNIGYLLYQRETSQVLTSSKGKQKSKSPQEPKKAVTTSSATAPKRKKEHSTTPISSISKENVLPKEASPQAMETTTTTTSTTTKKRKEKKQAVEIISTSFQHDIIQPQGDIPLVAEIVPTIEAMSEMAPVLETKQPPIEQANIEKTSDDLLPDQSPEEVAPSSERKLSSGEKERVSRTLKPSKELSKERKTLRRTRSLNLGTNDSEQKEAKERKTLQRTYSLMDMPPVANVIEEPAVKKEKKDKKPNKISIKRYLRSEEKDKRRKAEKQLAQQSYDNEIVQSQSSQSASGSSSHSDSGIFSYKKLTRKLSNRDLKSLTDVPLSENDIQTTLGELKEKGKIDFKRKNNTISATHISNPDVHITIHTHDKSDSQWFEKPEIKKDFLEFSSECDDDLKEKIESINNKK